MASPDRGASSPRLHPRIREAAEGDLPDWTRVGEQRRRHLARVAEVLTAWAEATEPRAGSPDPALDRLRWRAAGFLHDTLRDASGEELLVVLEADDGAGRSAPSWSVDWSAFRPPGEGGGGPGGIPKPLLHGPATALRLHREGVVDRELLDAVAYHTVGGESPGELPRALHCADFLDPGRTFASEWRAELRERYPTDPLGVCREILKAEIAYLLERERPILSGVARMWNHVRG